MSNETFKKEFSFVDANNNKFNIEAEITDRNGYLEFTDEAILIAAAVKLFDLKLDDLNDIEVDGNRITVQGIEYLAGDDNDMKKAHRDDADSYVDEEEHLIPEHLRPYFDRESFINDLVHEDRANALNRYNGREETTKINGTTIYFYQQ